MDVFPEKAGEKVGFPAVLNHIVAECRSRSGADAAARIAPLADSDEARLRLEQVEALQDQLRFGDPLPEAAFEPVDEVLRRAAPGGSFLEPEDLSAVRILAVCARRLNAWLVRASDSAPALSDLATRLQPLPDLEKRLDDLLDVDGRIREDASPLLRRLRRDAGRARDRLRVELLDTLRKASSEGWATEEQPTIRGGRMVIPMRAEAKRKMAGIVHDVSATGQTAYFEPVACVELNNDLRSIEAEERREIVRLLTEATDSVRSHRGSLSRNAEALTRIDMLIATARLSNRMNGIVPTDAREGLIDLRGARNPELLLRSGNADAVIPLSIRLDGQIRMIIISGPNAGGKSVALKTLGLFAVMLASGVPVPCDPGSRFDRFKGLFVELGDDQSVADDLSTFSSHLSHLRIVLERSDDRSLVLIDEAGSGTDPDEGSAMAQAVLESLLERGARCLVTTHHGPLKRFAHEAEGAANGMMSFDRESLRPTFRYVARVPGASYAFEIADRMGLAPDVIERSKTLLGSDRAALERLLADLDRRNRELEVQVGRAAAAAAQAEASRTTLADRLEALQQARSSIRERALEDADRLLREANAAVERAVREIRESHADPDIVRTAREDIDTVRESVRRQKRRGARRDPGKTGPAPGSAEIVVGDQVRIDEAGPTGEVLELRENEAMVAMGSARLRVARLRLHRVGGRKKQQINVRQVSDSPSGWVAARARARVDLRGQRVDEALAEVVRLVDEAVAAGLAHVEILHGKGTGALRSAIHDYLSTRPDVSSFDEAPIEQGGAGVTIVTF